MLLCRFAVVRARLSLLTPLKIRAAAARREMHYMSQRASLQFDYDAKYDVLYVALGDRDNSYGDDSEAGIIYLRDIDTDELTGVTVLDFMKRYRSNTLPPLPFSVGTLLQKIKS
mgnify:CR=1 FL=1